MIHKFISNDNKGNVNTLEIGSDYTKISKVVDPVNSDDAVNKRYVDQAAGKFIVTLTPTALDYSGTMDKTVVEINAAYEAGQEIWFSLSDGTLTYNSPANLIVDAGSGVVIFNAQLIDVEKNLVLCISTNYSDGGDTYSTNIYSLTPAS